MTEDAKPGLVLPAGRWIYLYPKRSKWWPVGRWPDPMRFAADCRTLGAVGVIAHEVLGGATKWLTAERRRQIRSEGVQLAVGVGSIAPSSAARCDRIRDALVAALDVPDSVGLVYDWEISYDGRKDEAQRIAEGVMKARPDAADRTVDVPWPEPLYYLRADGKKQWTHPNAPTAILGRLSRRARYVQAYSCADGGSRRRLRWARHPSQYAAIAQDAGLPPWEIYGTFRAYCRSLNDHIRTLLEEPSCVLWQWTELDPNARMALAAVEALSARGFTGPDAVQRFQEAEGLTADGLVGPKTGTSLGLHLD